MSKKWSDLPGNEPPSALPAELPLIPLISTVVFPGMIVNLQVARARNLRLVRDLETDGLLGLVLQTDLGASDPGPEHLSGIGVAARVINKVSVPGNTVQLILQGLGRVQITGWTSTEPYLVARVRDAEGDTLSSLSASLLISNAVALFEEFAVLDPSLSREAVSLVKMNMDGPGQLADQIATRLTLRTEDKREILEALDPETRLQGVIRILRREVQVKKIGADIHKQTQDEIGRAQREYFLRQQLKTIKKELGENAGPEPAGRDLRDQIEASALPAEVRREALAEMTRLEMMSPASAEYGVIRSYLEMLLELPWTEETEDSTDLALAGRILDEDHHGLEQVKERILEFLAVRQQGGGGRGPILCLAGPPGTGKTSLGRSVARALGRRFVRLSVGGLRDEAEIRGHRRTYVGAMPGKVLQSLKRCGMRNPVFLIDEIDKLGSDHRGDPASALLEVLDPEQNSTFRDLYIDAPFDLSRVLFIATANRTDTIPAALRDRLEIIEIPGYSEEEKLAIGRRYLVPRQREAAALPAEALSVDDDALTAILQEHAHDAGVRSFERALAAICRKVAKARALGRQDSVRVTRADVRSYLGAPRFFPELAGRVDEVGVATGLAWTPNGGEVLFIEVARTRGSGELILTGSLGDVMKESARAARTWLRANAADLGFDEADFDRQDLHIHVPAGGIPKDGPSAGIALTTALASVLTGRPVRHDIAMTGEVTLRGRVLPVGGVREKVLAARRAGIGTVILPLWNRKDLADVPPEVQADLRFVFVENVADVLETALGGEASAGVFIDRAAEDGGTAVPPPGMPPTRRKEGGRPAADH